MRERSRRYVRIRAPTISCLPSNRIWKRVMEVMVEKLHMPTWIYLPKRDELSFRVVFAFPKASSMGLVARICRSISLDSSSENLVFLLVASGGLTEARYRIMNLA